jgi:hypothetical protein
MNRWARSGALVVSAAALMFGSTNNVAAQASAPWIKDYHQARAEAKRTGKPMLLVFR